ATPNPTSHPGSLRGCDGSGCSMKKLNCLVAGLGIAGSAWWIRGLLNEERTFQELLRGLTVGPNPEEVLHRIAERSAKLVNGSASYVERLDAEQDEIVAEA